MIIIVSPVYSAGRPACRQSPPPALSAPAPPETWPRCASCRPGSPAGHHSKVHTWCKCSGTCVSRRRQRSALSCRSANKAIFSCSRMRLDWVLTLSVLATVAAPSSGELPPSLPPPSPSSPAPPPARLPSDRDRFSRSSAPPASPACSSVMVEDSGAIPRLLSHSTNFRVNFGLMPSNLNSSPAAVFTVISFLAGGWLLSASFIP